MKIAYVLNTYPQPSQSFIRREIHAHERAGVSVVRLAMRPFDGPLADPLNAHEREATEYVLKRGGMRLLAALAGRALRAPGRTARAAGLALRMASAARGNIARHLVYLAEAAHVADRCAAEGVDHIHAHFATNSAAVALLAHALGGPAYSFTTHGPEEFDAPASLALPLKIARARFAVAVSAFGRAQLYRWAPFAAWNRIETVHCGIEPWRFADPAALQAGPLRAVNIGRFCEQKGQMILVRAMAALKDSHPDIHLTLVGDGPMRPDLEKAIEAHGLEDRIALTGWLDEGRVNGELAAAHVLVMPSFAEGLPMVIMEAMAAGRPVISTFIAGIPELVTPDTGLLVAAGDADALAGAMAKMASLPVSRLAAMGQAGRDRVLARHDIDEQAARLRALIAGG
ncbi:glycosyltransferase [Oceaniglobus indicus]|uniref:glycosyltransferase n=1 Tax=Oceaniglobus indicus TaxID=2047749 RepID=UPI000C179870|nr:glycosyltransferase [Oceaniglobus indicus]